MKGTKEEIAEFKMLCSAGVISKYDVDPNVVLFQNIISDGLELLYINNTPIMIFTTKTIIPYLRVVYNIAIDLKSGKMGTVTMFGVIE